MKQPVILFDGICNLCCGWVQFLIRVDKKMTFRFSGLQSTYGKNLLRSNGLPTDKLETIIYIKGNQIFTESDAILKILKDLGGIWSIFGIFRIIPASFRNKFYRYIARIRYNVFGKQTSCLMPTAENKKRFLL